MKYRSHRGGVYYTPENTMPAFRYAVGAGYDFIETDPRITRDGVVVLMHDGTINRTCRNPDGTRIDHPVRVSDCTYEELLQYDAGIAMGEEFRGTRIPRLDELLALTDGTGITVSLDKAIKNDCLDALIDVVLAHNTRVYFSTSSLERIRVIQTRIPDACFDYDVNTEEDAYVSGNTTLQSREVYLPALENGAKWIDLETGEEYEGGQTITVDNISVADLPTFFNTGTTSEIAKSLVDGITEIYAYAATFAPTASAVES